MVNGRDYEFANDLDGKGGWLTRAVGDRRLVRAGGRLGDQAAQCADHDRAVRGQPRQPVLHSVRGLHPGQGSARRGAPASA